MSEAKALLYWLLRPSAPTSCVVIMLVTLLMVAVSGQQPKTPFEPTPAPLVPAEQAWMVTLPSLPAAGGALDNQHVYIPLQQGGTIALDRETGEIAWTNGMETRWPLLLGPSAVFVVTSDDAAAIDRATGALRWRVTLPSHPLSEGIAAGDLLLIPLENESITALRASDGGTAWEVKPKGFADPVRFGGDAHAAYLTMPGGLVLALNLADGKVLWRRTLDGTLSVPAVGRDRVLVGSTSNAFYALDASNGELEWSWGPTMVGGDVIGAGVDGEQVFFAGLDNLVHAVNRGNGNQRWQKPVPSRPTAPPIAFGGMVAVFGISPAIATFNAKTGLPLGTYVAPNAPGATVPPVLKGPPLVDPNLRPFRVAAAVITADGRAIGLRSTAMMFRDAPTVPLTVLPGKPLTREPQPGSPPR
jgi:outer membrane protein assembly factor BamB